MLSCHNADKLPQLWKASDNTCNVASWCTSYRAPCCLFVSSSANIHATWAMTTFDSDRPTTGFISMHSRPSPQAQIHQRTMAAVLEAYTCIAKQLNRAKIIWRNKKRSGTGNRNSLRWKGTWFHGRKLTEFHLIWICTFNMWDNGRSTLNKYIKFTHRTKTQIHDRFSVW